MTARLLIEYDGTGFAGWARQPRLRTVQGELEAAVATVLCDEVELTVAGRTDAGVHALGQVASHPGTEAPASALNALLSPDVRVLSSNLAPAGFDARRNAVGRAYRYRIQTRDPASAFEHRRVLHWPQPLDRAALDACAEALRGSHDFRAFTPTQTDHVRFERTVGRAEWVARDSGLDFEIEADSFMRHMVRVLVGTMLAVGGGRTSVEDFRRLLRGRARADAGDTAAPHGLYLVSVSY